jgi:hypothetical protein
MAGTDGQCYIPTRKPILESLCLLVRVVLAFNSVLALGLLVPITLGVLMNRMFMSDRDWEVLMLLGVTYSLSSKARPCIVNLPHIALCRAVNQT